MPTELPYVDPRKHMDIELLENYLTAQDLHDNGCWRFLQKHKRAPVFSEHRGSWLWKSIDADVLKVYGYGVFQKRSFLPNFILRQVPQEKREDFFVAKTNFFIENGIYMLQYSSFEEAFASVCMAWAKMKPVHRLFLSSVPKIEDIFI